MHLSHQAFRDFPRFLPWWIGVLLQGLHISLRPRIGRLLRLAGDPVLPLVGELEQSRGVDQAHLEPDLRGAGPDVVGMLQESLVQY